MRILIVSDIHSNYEALKAVVQDARARGPVDAIWNLGDIVGYGPEPGPCIKLLREAGAITVPGNHDLAAIGRVSLRDFNALAAEACRWTAQQLTPADKSFLEGLPLRMEQGPLTLVHGSPRDPVWEYLDAEDVAEENLPFLTTPACLVGHTHIPAVFFVVGGEPGKEQCRGFRLAPEKPLLVKGLRFIYNPGGVGQPRDGDPRASYAIYDQEAETLTHFRVSYDIAATQRRMKAAGLPEYLVHRLEVGR